MYDVFATYIGDLNRVLMASFSSLVAAQSFSGEMNYLSRVKDGSEYFDYEVVVHA